MIKPTTLYTSQKINKIILKSHARTSIYDYAKKQIELFLIPPVLETGKIINMGQIINLNLNS